MTSVVLRLSNLNKLIIVFNLLLNLILYLFAPNVYSEYYCLSIMLLFLFGGIVFMCNLTSNESRYFHLFFFISYLFVNFVYPVLVYPINPYYFKVFEMFKINDNLITKATALAGLGIASYMFGYKLLMLRFKIIFGSFSYKKICENNLVVLRMLVICVFFLFLLTCGKGFLHGEYNTIYPVAYTISVFFKILLTILIVYEILNIENIINKKIINLFKISKITMGLVLIYVVLFLRAGERGQIIELFMILFLLYLIYINKINKYIFILAIVFGFVFLNFISEKRVSNDKEYKLNSYVDLGMDLIIINRNLYASLDYVKENGYTYGKSLLANFISIIPLGNYIISETTGIDTFEYSSEVILTENGFGNKKVQWGLGTNMIGDIYMAFGTFGVVCIMTISGSLFSLLFSRLTNNPQTIVIVSILYSYSIYLPRSSIFMLLSPWFLSYLVGFFFNTYYNNCLENGNE